MTVDLFCSANIFVCVTRANTFIFVSHQIPESFFFPCLTDFDQILIQKTTYKFVQVISVSNKNHLRFILYWRNKTVFSSKIFAMDENSRVFFPQKMHRNSFPSEIIELRKCSPFVMLILFWDTFCSQIKCSNDRQIWSKAFQQIL